MGGGKEQYGSFRHFKTTLVTVRLVRKDSNNLFDEISKQHLLRFDSEANKKFFNEDLFQNNTCYGSIFQSA